MRTIVAACAILLASAAVGYSADPPPDKDATQTGPEKQSDKAGPAASRHRHADQDNDQDDDPIAEASSAEELKLRLTLPGPAARLNFSPDGKTLAAESEKEGVKLWDLVSGNCTLTFAGTEHRAYRVAFGSDNRRFALARIGIGAELRDFPGGKIVRTFSKDNDVFCIAFSADGKKLATGYIDKVKVWDAESGKVIATYAGNYEQLAVRALAFSPDGKYLVSQTDGHEIAIRDPNTGNCNIIFNKAEEYADFGDIVFSPNGKDFAVAGKIARDWIGVWNVDSGKMRIKLPGHSPCGVAAFAFRPDGKSIVSVGVQGKVKIWDLASGKTTSNLRLKKDPCFEAAVGPDGSMVAAQYGDDEKSIRVWDLKPKANEKNR